MSNLKIIEELCGILHDMADIIEGQQKLLMEHDAVALEEETARVRKRYTDLLGAEEWPEVAEEQAAQAEAAGKQTDQDQE